MLAAAPRVLCHAGRAAARRGGGGGVYINPHPAALPSRQRRAVSGVGGGASPDYISVGDACDELDLPRVFTKQELKNAYRQRLMAIHPDKKGRGREKAEDDLSGQHHVREHRYFSGMASWSTFKGTTAGQDLSGVYRTNAAYAKLLKELHDKEEKADTNDDSSAAGDARSGTNGTDTEDSSRAGRPETRKRRQRRDIEAEVAQAERELFKDLLEQKETSGFSSYLCIAAFVFCSYSSWFLGVTLYAILSEQGAVGMREGGGWMDMWNKKVQWSRTPIDMDYGEYTFRSRMFGIEDSNVRRSVDIDGRKVGMWLDHKLGNMVKEQESLEERMAEDPELMREETAWKGVRSTHPLTVPKDYEVTRYVEKDDNMKIHRFVKRRTSGLLDGIDDEQWGLGMDYKHYMMPVFTVCLLCFVPWASLRFVRSRFGKWEVDWLHLRRKTLSGQMASQPFAELILEDKLVARHHQLRQAHMAGGSTLRPNPMYKVDPKVGLKFRA